jgi:ATP-dependent helicase/nuclease subunit A
MGQGVVTSQNGSLTHHPARAEAAGEVVLHPMIPLPTKNADVTFLLPTHQHHGQTHAAIVADTIASAIDDLLASGKGLPSRQNQPITPSDIWILLQRRGTLQTALLSALGARGIPVAGGDRIFLKETLAVKDLLALLLFMVEPDDDFTLACLLKSPVGGLGEDDLFTLCHGRAGTLWSSLYHHAQPDDAPQNLKQTYARLQHFLNHADIWTPHQTLVQYLCVQGGYGDFRSAFGGEVDEVLHLFLSYALRFETEVTPTLAGFLPWFDRHAVDIKRETLGHGVRIQSIHSAKGLEAPVIILADAAHRPKSHFGPIVWLPEGFLWILPKRVLHALAPLKEAMKKQDDEEYHRLLYVAMTRAEDALHIFGAESQKKNQKEDEADSKKSSPPAHWYQAVADVLKPQAIPLGDSLYPVYALGALPQALAPVAEAVPALSSLPSWVTAPVPPVKEAVNPTAHVESEAITLGLAIHLAMQHCLIGRIPTEDTLRQFLSAVYPADVANTAAQRAWAAYQGDDLSTLRAQAQRIETEVTLRYQGKTLRLDALMVCDRHVVIVDFKSGNVTRAQAQMDLYKDALCALYPHHTVETRVIGV